MKLENLAPYLPYGLKGLVKWEHKNETHVAKLYGALQNDLCIENPYCGFDYCDYEDFKPTLRPLSDLTKEIEHNGERFVPREKFYGNPLDFDITKNSYCVVKKLFEWHFDVFGLIEKGEAIDVNTL